MAADFSEGRLETFVGSPQKELAGTQNAYFSYLVTTKVSPVSWLPLPCPVLPVPSCPDLLNLTYPTCLTYPNPPTLP